MKSSFRPAGSTTRRDNTLGVATAATATLLFLKTYFVVSTTAFAPSLNPPPLARHHAGSHLRYVQQRRNHQHYSSSREPHAVPVRCASTSTISMSARKPLAARVLSPFLLSLLRPRTLPESNKKGRGRDCSALDAITAIEGGEEAGKLGTIRSSVVVAPGEARSSRPMRFLKGAMRTLGKVLHRIREVPEDAADEGKFLLMAAVVGVLTGSAGVFWGFRDTG